GKIFCIAGKAEQAIKYLEYSRSIDVPEQGRVSISVKEHKLVPDLLLGEAYSIMGDKGKALEAFKRAYEFEPSETVKDKIEALQEAH
ncbi:MAG: tetratricopeptide repeat protein, partial [Candidatus Saganbacteria bacterium]|nr:tetratricopeptide repeat protein [Candidatus Saganbacteria bacterium]